MKARFLCLIAALSLGSSTLACGGDATGRPRVRPDEDGGGVMNFEDADGDTIPDPDEGRADETDTDGDGTPDYLDSDSDEDGIPDAVEGGGRPDGEPVDHDGDGTPDFRDLDSDGNGIPDGAEGGLDLDGDRVPNSGDTDDDGDGILDVVEIGGDPVHPIDSDGDATQDYQDPDSDGDTIGDRDEQVYDTDDDGTEDRFDLDSDADGVPDADEAGDADVSTLPRDSDGDGTPDFRDNDADNDGLADGDEIAAGTDPFSDDTDGDGVSDLVEVASGTSATDPSDSPRTRGDFVFLEPYMEAPSPPRDTLDFATDIRVADVYFLIDTTGSMGGAIGNVRTSLSTPGTGIIDQVRASIPDTWFGVGDFKDFGDPYIYTNRTSMTPDATTAQAGVNSLSASGGGDYAEGDVPALYAVATGMGVTSSPSIPPRTGCPAGTFGYPCFRDGAVPIVVLVTDAPFHNGPGGTNPYRGYTVYNTMRDAVVAARIRVIGIAVGSGPLADLRAIATDSGAVDGSGAPLVSTASSGSVSSEVVNQIRTLASATRLDISVRYEDDASDAVDSYAAFVDHIEANTAGDAARGCAARAAVDTDGDGYVDTFRDVTAGERVCFDIVVKQNVTVMPTTMPQLFRATVRVVGDGFTELDSRDVYFLVPPHIEPPGGPG